MKSTVKTLGYAALALAAVLVAAFIVLAATGNRMDRESKSFVDAAVPAIMESWDVEELQKRASDGLNDSLDYDDLQDYFDTLRNFGRLIEYKGSTGDSNITISRSGCTVNADYQVSADFESGTVDIQLWLVRRGGRWMIDDFSISPSEYTDRHDVI